MDGFQSQSIEQRRQQIVAARVKGSVPEDMKLALDKAAAHKKITFITDDINDVKCQNGGALLIGPIARNIAGARHSGRRITAAFNREMNLEKVIKPPIPQSLNFTSFIYTLLRNKIDR